MGMTVMSQSDLKLNLPQNAESAQQRQILDSLPVLVFLERDGKIVFANAEARQALGLGDDESICRPVEDVIWGLFPAADAQTPGDAARLGGQLLGGQFQATLLARNGRMLPIEGTYGAVNAEQRESIIVAHPGGRDRAPRSRLMDEVLASVPDAVMIVHEDHVLYTNPAFTQMFGHSAEEMAGAHPRDFIVPATRLHEMAMLSHAVSHQGRLAMETVRQTKSGELVDVALLAGPLVVNGTNVGYAVSYRDIGERKQVEARLQHDAMHDVLTGLPNRALFLDRLTLALSRRERRKDHNCGMLIVDLDRFKVVNDALGHAAGDTLLATTAERLRAVLRPQDTAARLGGDEFGILVDGVANVPDLQQVAKRVSNELEKSYTIYGHPIQVGASIGVAIADPDRQDAEGLIQDADYAMYRAKQEGGGRFEVFDRHLEVRVTARQERERELRHMLEERSFEVCYEPVYLLGDGRLVGLEAVLRSAEGGADSSGDMFALAEETGLSIGIGREVTEGVCRQLRAWSDARRELTVSINLSRRQFYHPDLLPQVIKTLADTGADPSRLMFEVAETTLNENPDAAVGILQRMVDLNLRVAVDDFGSSLAPINHLVRLPIDVVKLDARLTALALGGGKQAAMIASLIQLGQSLGVQVVAQGIETAEQLDALSKLGCELGQGSLMSRSLDAVRAQKLAGMSFWTTGASDVDRAPDTPV
jgi:diguanylate cyclase (GGDEF)-like protein/PAS domain S-box-containing protein